MIQETKMIVYRRLKFMLNSIKLLKITFRGSSENVLHKGDKLETEVLKVGTPSLAVP